MQLGDYFALQPVLVYYKRNSCCSKNAGKRGILLEIRQLKTFIGIVKLGSFSQAAQFLGYTQSTVTTHIQLLEKEFNTVLFERFGHSLMLTTEGEKLYDYAEQIVYLSEKTENALSNFVVPRGSLVLGMTESICTYHMQEVLGEYVALYPEVELKLRLGVGSDFRSLLRRNMIDMAVLLEKEIKEIDLTADFLWPEPVVMVAGKEHRLVARKKVLAADLAGETLIFTDSNSNYQTVLEDSLEKSRVKPQKIMEIGQIQTLKEMVKRGLGIAVLPLAAVADDFQAGVLCQLQWQGRNLQTNAYIVHHKDKWQSLPMKAFVKLVRDRLL